ncbi:MAG: putative toxin-antitoxin system toxin component, PIN family [Anaerolineales bacterium]|nr:putative toxin-antitoxin system toxin component, PIN family [Anaerolineales bacterium]
MVRAVIDTNLIISYLLTQGETMSRLVAHWEKGHFVYLISPLILAEVRNVVNRPRLRQYLRTDPSALLELLEADTEFVPGELYLSGICRDPKDDKFIACAIEGNANYIVTGDSDLLTLNSYEHVAMIRAYDFVEFLDHIYSHD